MKTTSDILCMLSIMPTNSLPSTKLERLMWQGTEEVIGKVDQEIGNR